MKKIDDGGPAFPVAMESRGMSLRDWYAGLDLQGIISAHASEGVQLPSQENAALAAFGYADQMLIARKGGCE